MPKTTTPEPEVRPLVYLPAPLPVRTPHAGSRNSLLAQVRHAKARHERLLSELTEKERARDVVKARRADLMEERARLRAAGPEDEALAVAKGTLSVDDAVNARTRAAVVEAALVPLSAEYTHAVGVAHDAQMLARDADRDVRHLEADLVLVDLRQALAPHGDLLARYFEASGDAALVVLPPQATDDDMHE